MPPRNSKYAAPQEVTPRQKPQTFREDPVAAEDPNIAAAQAAPAPRKSPFRYGGSTSEIFQQAVSSPLTSILSDEAMESQRSSIRQLTGGEGVSARILDMLAEGAESPVGIATLGGLLGTGLTRAVRARPAPPAGPVARVPSTTGTARLPVPPMPSQGPLRPSTTLGPMTATVPPLARPGVPGGRLAPGVGPRNLQQRIDEILQQASQQADQPMAAELPSSALNPVPTADATESVARGLLQQRLTPDDLRARLEADRLAFPPKTAEAPPVPTGRLVGPAPQLEDSLVDALEAARRTPSPGPVSAAEHVVSGLPAPHGPAGRRVPAAVSDRRMDELVQKFGGQAESAGPTQPPKPVEPEPATLFGTHKGVQANVYSSEANRLIEAGDYDGAANTITQALGSFFKGTSTDVPTMRKGTKFPKAGTTPGVHPAMKGKASTGGPKGFGQAEDISIDLKGKKATSGSTTLGSGFGSLSGMVKKHPVAAARVGSGALGANIGGGVGDTPEERQKNAVIAGAASAFLVPNIARMAASVAKAKPVQSAIYTSVLSSPSSVLKAYLGAYGGAISYAMEHPNVSHKVVRELMPDRFTPAFLAGLKRANAAIGAQQTGTQAPNIMQRIYGAADFAARKAMRAGGATDDEAARFTLSGLPTTATGQDVLSFMERRGLPLKLMTSLFPRVGIQILERGAERMGAGLAVPSLRTSGSQAIKTGLGASAVAAGYAAEDDIPGWLQPFVAAAAGPYTLPVGVGMVARKGYEKGGGGEAVEQGLRDVTGRLPLPSYGPYEAFRRVGSGAIAVPNIVQDIAELRDPEDRVPEGFFGGTKAKIPGLRETLPVRGKRLNIEGKPTDQGKGKIAELTKKYVPESVQRALTPRTREVNPYSGVDERVVKELKRLDVTLTSPSFDKEIQIGKRKIKVPTDLAEKRRAESREKLVPQIKKLMDSSRYQRSDDGKKKLLMQRVIQQAQAAGAAKARGSLARSLKQRGSL